MPNEPEAINIALAEKLGVQPQLSWHVLSPDETSSVITCTSKAEAEEWLARVVRENPGTWLKDYRVGAWKVYPRYADSADGCFDLIAEMAKRGYHFQITTYPDGRVVVECWRVGDGLRHGRVTDSSIPMAVALAAKAAIEFRGGK